MTTTILSILLGIGGMIGWGIYDFLGGVFSKQIGSFKSFLWSQLAGFISGLLLLIVFTINFNLSIFVVFLSIVAAVCYSAGYMFFFKGFEIDNLSIIAATMNLWAVFTMFFAFFLMGQRLTAIQTLGVMMIISGATLASVNWNEISHQGVKLSRGGKEAILGAFFFGIFWNISEIITEDIGWVLTTLLIKFGILVFLLAFSFIVKQEISLAKTNRQTKLMVMVMGVIEAGAVALVNYGLTIGDAILITPIASALSIVTIFLAIVFLKEPITKPQGAGIILAITGIILTAF